MLLGEGWGRLELGQEPLHTFSWALDGQATVDVPRPLPATFEGDGGAVELDFVAVLMPFLGDGSGQQRLELVADDRSLASAVLTEGWQELRLPLPPAVFGRPWTRLELRFSRADRPSDVGLGADRRRLSAAFRELAIVPRRAAEGSRLRVESAATAGGRRLSMPTGSVWTVPVAPGRQGSLEVSGASSRCDGCRLRLEHAMETPGGRRTSPIWEGDAAELDGSRIAFRTPTGRFGRLVASWAGPAGEDPLQLELRADFLVSEARADTVRSPAEEAGGAEPAPHLFLYLVDTLRATELGPYATAELDPPLPTPAVDRFASHGVVYEQAWTSSSWTLPATVSVLTGVYPDRHGIMTGQQRFDGGGLPTLGQRLGEQGYATLGLSQSYVASARFGIDRGFEAFELDDQLNGRALRSERLRLRFLRWLEDATRDPGRPLFAYLHTVGPHGPYEPAGSLRRRAEAVGAPLPPSDRSPLPFELAGHGEEPAKLRRLKALYEGEVGYAGREFGRFVALLEHLGLYRPALVALLSDHGEEFAEHRGYGHGRTLYEEQLRVPLIVKFPHQRWAGQRVRTAVSTVDLVPTALELAGPELLTSGPALDGRSLRPDRLADAGPRLLVSQVRPKATDHLAAVDYVALRSGATKCILSRGETDQWGEPVPTWQVFDLETDPGENRPLPVEDPRVERCQRQWQRWQELRTDLGPEGSTAPVDEEALEQLRALGYIGG